jgi:hypothetical protein
MDYRVEAETLFFRLIGDFNLSKVRKIKNVLANYVEAKEINFDLISTRLVNSEAIIFLYELKKDKKISISNTSSIFHEVLDTLDLQDEFREIIKN